MNNKRRKYEQARSQLQIQSVQSSKLFDDLDDSLKKLNLVLFHICYGRGGVIEIDLKIKYSPSSFSTRFYYIIKPELDVLRQVNVCLFPFERDNVIISFHVYCVLSIEINSHQGSSRNDHHRNAFLMFSIITYLSVSKLFHFVRTNLTTKWKSLYRNTFE